MTNEREAKVWMLAAGAMVVWACTMVGCSTSVVSDTALPLNRPTTTAVAPTWSSTPTVTLSADTVPNADGTDAELSLGEIASATVFAPSQPDVIVLQPRQTSPGFDVELSGLSIAQPLVSAKRLLVAAVTMLPPVPTPEWAAAASAVAHADLTDQPVAAAAGIVQRLAYEQPDADILGASLGLAVLDRSSVMLPPWQTDPTPTPTVAASMTADEAKFDAAGIAAIILGAMVLLFGGEAVVLWMLHRRREQARAVQAEAVVSEDPEEASIFRFPEPVYAEAEQTYSQAA